MERQTDKFKNKQTDKQMDRQTDSGIETINFCFKVALPRDIFPKGKAQYG
jgi:hypothetical protein